MEPMVLGSIPATKPVFFLLFFFRCWLIHSFFLLQCILQNYTSSHMQSQTAFY